MKFTSLFMLKPFKKKENGLISRVLNASALISLCLRDKAFLSLKPQ